MDSSFWNFVRIARHRHQQRWWYLSDAFETTLECRALKASICLCHLSDNIAFKQRMMWGAYNSLNFSSGNTRWLPTTRNECLFDEATIAWNQRTPSILFVVTKPRIQANTSSSSVTTPFIGLFVRSTAANSFPLQLSGSGCIENFWISVIGSFMYREAIRKQC